MKLKDKQELINLTADGLGKRLSQAQAGLTEIRLKVQVGQIKDVKAVGKKRQEIAILKTLLKLKEA